MLPPFQHVIDDYGADVWRFCRALAGQEADDCYQETLLAALKAYPRLRDASNLRSWLFTIAHRKVIDDHRAAKRRPVPSDRLPEGERRSIEPPDGVWEHVGALPPKQKAAIAHRYLNDMPYRDIAALLDCSEEAARQNVRQGLKRLREELA